MSKKVRKDNRKTVWYVLIGVFLVLVVAMLMRFNNGKKLTADFFVNDDTKYVAIVETDVTEWSVPLKQKYVIYFHDGEKVTGVKYYYEFESAEDAATAKEYYYASNSEEAPESLRQLEIQDNYLVETAEAWSYEGVTKEDAKAYTEYLESLNNGETDAGVIVETDAGAEASAESGD